MSHVRRLDRDRPYGEIFPRTNGAVYEQDHLQFDAEGLCLDKTAPPIIESEPPAPQNGPASNAAVSISGELRPRPSVEWQTMHFAKLRNLLMREKGFKAANQVAALIFLDQNGLISKE